MNIGQAFLMAIKSIKNNKARSMLTMLGIIIGVAAVITMVTLIQAQNQLWIDQLEANGTNKIDINYWSQNDISFEIYDHALGMTDLIIGFSPSNQRNRRVEYREKSENIQVAYGSHQYDVCFNFEIEKGSMFTYSNVEDRSKVAVIGSMAKENLFNFEDPIGKTITIDGVPFTVVGVFEQKMEVLDEWSARYSPDNVVAIPYTNNRILDKSTEMDQFVAVAKDSESVAPAVEEFKTFLRPFFAMEWDYNVYSNNEWIESANEGTQTLSLIGGGIAGISLLVGGIGIMNIMLVSVTERTREIGIRKAIGAKRLSIVTQFLIEASVVSLCGGAIGIAVGSFISAVMGKIMIPGIDVVLPSLGIMLGAAGISVAIGIFFGFYPANKASKLSPIEALRSE